MTCRPGRARQPSGSASVSNVSPPLFLFLSLSLAHTHTRARTHSLSLSLSISLSALLICLNCTEIFYIRLNIIGIMIPWPLALYSNEAAMISFSSDYLGYRSRKKSPLARSNLDLCLYSGSRDFEIETIANRNEL